MGIFLESNSTVHFSRTNLNRLRKMLNNASWDRYKNFLVIFGRMFFVCRIAKVACTAFFNRTNTKNTCLSDRVPAYETGDLLFKKFRNVQAKF